MSYKNLITTVFSICAATSASASADVQTLHYELAPTPLQVNRDAFAGWEINDVRSIEFSFDDDISGLVSTFGSDYFSSASYPSGQFTSTPLEVPSFVLEDSAGNIDSSSGFPQIFVSTITGDITLQVQSWQSPLLEEILLTFDFTPAELANMISAGTIDDLTTAADVFGTYTIGTLAPMSLLTKGEFDEIFATESFSVIDKTPEPSSALLSSLVAAGLFLKRKR